MQPHPQNTGQSRCRSLAFLTVFCFLLVFLDIAFTLGVRKFFRPQSRFLPRMWRPPSSEDGLPTPSSPGAATQRTGIPRRARIPPSRIANARLSRLGSSLPRNWRPPHSPASSSGASRPTHLPDDVPDPVCDMSHRTPRRRLNDTGPRPANRGAPPPPPDHSHARGFVFLKMWGLYYNRIGNLMWAYASLIGIARTNNYQPRIEALDYRKLQGLFPAIEVTYQEEEAKTKVPVFREGHEMMFNETLMRVPPNVALFGWLQSHRYFTNHTDKIRSLFRFNVPVEEAALEFIASAKRVSGQCADSMTVALHVRRGDISRIMVVPNDYWQRAIDHLKAKFPNRNMTYIVMAGGNTHRNLDGWDYYFARQHIKVPYIPTPISHPPHLDLAILAYSDAVVMSGGSFGFWGGYLNHDVCIAPDCPLTSDYYGHIKNDDYYPPWCERLHC